MRTPLLIFLQILLLSCGSNESEKEKFEDAPPESHEQILAEGQKVYQTYCSVCHQRNGEGVPQLYPPLSGTEWVTGDKNRLISILLFGLNEPIVVNGEEYENMMPQHNFLSDEKIAAVLTFIRSNFGNNASAITPKEVAQVRAKVN